MTRYAFPHIPDEPERLAIALWLRRHDIDPDQVAVPGWIEVRPGEIAWLAYVTDPHTGKLRLNADRTKTMREARTVQLAAPPAPFPTYALSVPRGLLS